MRISLVFLLLFFASYTSATTPYLLRCGDVFDSKSARLIGARTIVIEDTKIKSISKDLVKVQGAQEIDLSGFTCLPGFIDLHVHLSGQSNPQAYLEEFRLDGIDFAFRSVAFAERTLMAGFTSVRDLSGEVALHLRNAINQGVVKGPRVFAAGKVISSTGGHGDPTNGWSRELSSLKGPPGPTEGVINGVEEARQAVRQGYKEGADLIKITATGGVLSLAKSADAPLLTVEEIKAIVETAKDYGFAVAAHAHGKEGAKRSIIAGVNSIEHGTFLDEEAFALMKKHHTWYIPTLSAGKFVAEKAKVEGFYPDIIRPKAARVGPLLLTTFSKGYKAGVKIAFGTDAGVSIHGENAEEFVLMVEGGMPANIALQAATYNAARVLGNSEIGSLEAGYLADVVAVRGNPINDIKVTKNVQFVMKDGVVYKSN